MTTTDPPDRIARHPDLAAEQAVLAHAYACLLAMRERTETALGVRDNAAQAVDAEIAAAHLQQRLRSLDVDVDGLSFGRLDEENGDTWYVGRRHVEDAKGDPVVVDWRADVSTPFYRATPADALGLDRRRRFMMTGTHLDDLYDEVFDDPDSVHAARHGGIPDPLLVELERSRTGEMRDIVATIAAEQDIVIRSELDTCLVVQGGPGTGKTAIGLHRAAFLLYEHRDRLDRDGVLVVGPNPVFLRYISQVLPSLGEAATRQTTMERLVSGSSYRVRTIDPPARAALLGDARLGEVLRRALRMAVQAPADDIAFTTDWGRVTLRATEVAEAIDDIAAREVSHATGRTALRARLERLAWQRHFELRGEDAAPSDRFERGLRASSGFQSALTKIWPAITGPVLAKRVLTNKAALARAAEGVLTADEQALLRRKGVTKLADEQWSLGELVVLDEAEALASGVARTYGHIVVDEAQDLSAMALRALARRCPTRSMTVLGDLAQATEPGAQESWDDALAHLGHPETGRVEELALGYRVPAPIMEFANQLLPTVAPNVLAAGSVREVGRAPRMVSGSPSQQLPGVVAELAEAWHSVGIIAPEPLHADLGAALTEAGIAFAAGLRAGTGETVTLLTPPEAKGLEFDAVVVVDPAAIVAASERGAGALYVAMTRATQRLYLVTEGELPEGLRVE